MRESVHQVATNADERLDLSTPAGGLERSSNGSSNRWCGLNSSGLVQNTVVACAASEAAGHCISSATFPMELQLLPASCCRMLKHDRPVPTARTDEEHT